MGDTLSKQTYLQTTVVYDLKLYVIKNEGNYALHKNDMLIFSFKNNTWLIVLDLRQLVRWETSSPAFEKSLSEGTGVAGMRNKCIALSDN